MNPLSISDMLYGLLGGCLIGLGSILALAFTGKVPGISGVFARLFHTGTNDKTWRILFLFGLISGAALVFYLTDLASYVTPKGRTGIWYGIAGLLVGMGTRIGGGCTSGHGVCGIGMGAKDSILATVVFMASGIATVAVVNFFI